MKEKEADGKLVWGVDSTTQKCYNVGVRKGKGKLWQQTEKEYMLI